MADNYNMKKAVRFLMIAREKKFVWKLLLQIILDRPSAIVNAFNKIDKKPEWPPSRVIIAPGKPMQTIFHCQECRQDVKCVGLDGRCGRCNPTLAG